METLTTHTKIRSFDEYKTYLKDRCPEIMEDCKLYYEKEDSEDIYNMLCSFFYECYKRGLKAEFRFGKVFVQSKNYDNWMFTPTFGKISLMHKNAIYRAIGEYHLQFCKEISLRQLAVYIDEHDRAKYTPEYVHFSVHA